MSDDGAEQQNVEQAVGPPPRKKVMRRIGQVDSVSDMGVMGAVQHLKSEVRQLRAVGYTALFQGDAPVLQSHLSSYLSGSAVRAYDDPHGGDYQQANSTEYPKFGEQASAFSLETGTITMNFNEELCFRWRRPNGGDGQNTTSTRRRRFAFCHHDTGARRSRWFHVEHKLCLSWRFAVVECPQEQRRLAIRD